MSGHGKPDAVQWYMKRHKDGTMSNYSIGHSSRVSNKLTKKDSEGAISITKRIEFHCT